MAQARAVEPVSIPVDVGLVMTASGYQFSAPTIYKQLSSLAIGEGTAQQTYQVAGGFGPAVERLACGATVLLEHEVTRLRPTSTSQVKVRYQANGQQSSARFDAVVIATRPAQACDILPASSNLRPIFAKVTNHTTQYLTVVARINGLPKPKFTIITENCTVERVGHVTAFQHMHPGSNVALVWLYAERSTSTKKILRTVTADIKRFGGQVLELLELHRWEMSPYFAQEDLAGGIWNQLDNLQGRGGIYVVGGGVSFDLTGPLLQHAQHVASNYLLPKLAESTRFMIQGSEVSAKELELTIRQHKRSRLSVLLEGNSNPPDPRLIDNIDFQRIAAELAGRFQALTQARGARVFHRTATTLLGTLTIVPHRLPPHPRLVPGSTFPVLVRHANGSQDDDLAVDNRGATLRILECTAELDFESGWLDLLLTTGATFLAGTAREFHRFTLGTPAERVRLAYQDPRIAAAAWEMMRMPVPFTDLHYYSKTCSQLVSSTGESSPIRFRLVPQVDRGYEHGAVTRASVLPPERFERPAGDIRSQHTLHENLLTLVSAAPILYRLQVQTPEGNDRANLSALNAWTQSPWQDLATLSLTTVLDESKLARVRFDTFQAPSGLAPPLAVDPDDPASLAHVRSLVYETAACARLGVPLPQPLQLWLNKGRLLSETNDRLLPALSESLETKPAQLAGAWNLYDRLWLVRVGLSSAEFAIDLDVTTLPYPHPYCRLVIALSVATLFAQNRDLPQAEQSVRAALDVAVAASKTLASTAFDTYGPYFSFQGLAARSLMVKAFSKVLHQRSGDLLSPDVEKLLGPPEGEPLPELSEQDFETDSLLLHFAEHGNERILLSPAASDHASRLPFGGSTTALAARLWALTKNRNLRLKLDTSLRGVTAPGLAGQEAQFALYYTLRAMPGSTATKQFPSALARVSAGLKPTGASIDDGSRTDDCDATAVSLIVLSRTNLPAAFQCENLEKWWNPAGWWLSADQQNRWCVSLALHVLEAVLLSPDATPQYKAVVWNRTVTALETRAWVELHHLSPMYIWEKITFVIGSNCTKFGPTKVHLDALDKILSSQQASGGFCTFNWPANVEETGLALLALKSARSWALTTSRIDKAVAAGTAWLWGNLAQPRLDLWIGKLSYQPDTIIDAIVYAALTEHVISDFLPLDRPAVLPPPQSSRPGQSVSFERAVEVSLQVWAKVLEVSPAALKPSSNLLELGLTSLLMKTAVFLLSQELGLQVSGSDIFNHPVIKDFAKTISAQSRSAPAAEVRGPVAQTVHSQLARLQAPAQAAVQPESSRPTPEAPLSDRPRLLLLPGLSFNKDSAFRMFQSRNWTSCGFEIIALDPPFQFEPMADVNEPFYTPPHLTWADLPGFKPYTPELTPEAQWAQSIALVLAALTAGSFAGVIGWSLGGACLLNVMRRIHSEPQYASLRKIFAVHVVSPAPPDSSGQLLGVPSLHILAELDPFVQKQKETSKHYKNPTVCKLPIGHQVPDWLHPESRPCRDFLAARLASLV